MVQVYSQDEKWPIVNNSFLVNNTPFRMILMTMTYLFEIIHKIRVFPGRNDVKSVYLHGLL